MAILFTSEQLAKGTASRMDGISEQEEENYRAKTCEFVLALIKKLDMNRTSMFNACVLVHRFFTYESFKKRDRLLVGATAVFLGGKIAENPRRLLDVVGHYHALRHKTSNLPPEKGQIVQDLKEEVLGHEKLMLHVMGFNLSIETAGPKFAELGAQVRTIAFSSSEKRKEDYERLVQWSSNLLNDLYSKTSLCLRCEAALMAQIVVYLAVRHCGLPEPEGSSWRQVLGITEDARTFCLIKRASDLYRHQKYVAYRSLVRQMDQEVAFILSKEGEEETKAGGGQGKEH